MVLKLSDCAETLEEARGVIDRQEERMRKQAEYSIALQRAIERHCAGELVPEEIAKLCPHHAQKLNAIQANIQGQPRPSNSGNLST